MKRDTTAISLANALGARDILKEKGVQGVITYSTGNHGTSVATSAKMFGLQAVVVLPENANPLKVMSIRDAGAEIIEYGKDFEESGKKVAVQMSGGNASAEEFQAAIKYSCLVDGMVE